MRVMKYHQKMVVRIERNQGSGGGGRLFVIVVLALVWFINNNIKN